MNIFIVSERLLLTLWVGSLWAIGYISVPTLFHVLADNRPLAGSLAGSMFTAVSYIGLICGTLLMLSLLIFQGRRWLRLWQAWALLVMLALIVVGEFVVQPAMQALKLQGLVPESDAAAQFGRLHGVASVLYLANSLLGLALVLFGLRKNSQN